MKKNFFFIILLVVLLIGGYLSYRIYFLKPPVELSDLIPGSAGILIEIGRTDQVIEQLSMDENASKFTFIPAFKQIVDMFKDIDTIQFDQGNLKTISRNQPIAFSLHQVSNSELGILWYFKPKDQIKSEYLKSVLNYLKQRNNYKYESRKYHGKDIFEIKASDGNEIFSYIILDEYFIGSQKGFLVEDAIRHSAEERNSDVNGPTSKASVYDKDVKITFYHHHLPGIISVFTDGTTDRFNSLTRLAEVSEFSFEGTKDQFTGFGMSNSTNPKSIINLLHDCPIHSPSFFNLVSRETEMLQYFSFGAGADLYIRLKYFDTLAQLNYNSNWIKLEDQYGIRADEFYSILSEEAALTDFNESGLSMGRALFIKMAAVEQGSSYLQGIAEKSSKLQQDSIYKEQYGAYEIIQIPVPEFPLMIFGYPFEGFAESYYTIVGRLVIIASDIGTLKNLINDIEIENTWGKSMKHLQLLEQNVSKSNYLLIVNFPQFIKNHKSFFNAYYQDFIEKRFESIKQFEYLIFQMNSLDKEILSGMHITLNPVTPKNSGLAQTRQYSNRAISLAHPIISKPFLFRDKRSNGWVVLLQDIRGSVHYINSNGEIAWADSTGDYLKSPVYEISLSNRSREFLFATEGTIQVLDEDGYSPAGFPINIKGLPIHQFGVLDYDKTKNYRFAFSDQNGGTVLSDLDGNFLEGWSPRQLDGKLSAPLLHVRVKNKDCLVAIQEKGVLQLLNRKGEFLKGFPVDLKTEIGTGFLIAEGSELSKTTISLITSLGELVIINFNGEILSRNPFERVNKESRFYLVKDASSRSFMVVRQDYSTLTFMDRKGKILFVKQFDDQAIFRFQYYRTSLVEDIIVVHEVKNKKTRFFRFNGEELFGNGFDNENDIALVVSSNSKNITLYSTFENNLYLTELSAAW